MKEAYKRMISIRGYVDTDKVRERLNRNYGVSAEGKDIHKTYSKEEKDYIANDIIVTKEVLKTLVKTGDEDEY